MQSRVFALVVTAFVIFPTFSRGALVLVSSVDQGTPTAFVDQNLEPISVGFVSLGSFVGSGGYQPFNFDNWTSYGESLEYGTPSVGDFAGFFSGYVVENLTDANHPLIGQAIYVIGGNGSGIANSTSFFVLRSNSLFQRDFPAFSEEVYVNNEAIQLGDVQVLTGVHLSNYIYDPSGINAPMSAIVLVPEPSAGALGIFGMSFLLLRRKMR